MLKIFDYGDIRDDKFVMTTSHAEEPLSEALWFARNCAFYPDVDAATDIWVTYEAFRVGSLVVLGIGLALIGHIDLLIQRFRSPAIRNYGR